MLDGLIKVIFVPKYVFRVVFKGGILGGVLQFWVNPYLNSTTVLFDMLSYLCLYRGMRDSLKYRLMEF